MPQDFEAQDWVRSLVTKEQSAGAVRKTWITASDTVFRWAMEHKKSRDHLPYFTRTFRNLLDALTASSN